MNFHIAELWIAIVSTGNYSSSRVNAILECAPQRGRKLDVDVRIQTPIGIGIQFGDGVVGVCSQGDLRDGRRGCSSQQWLVNNNDGSTSHVALNCYSCWSGRPAMCIGTKLARIRRYEIPIILNRKFAISCSKIAKIGNHSCSVANCAGTTYRRRADGWRENSERKKAAEERKKSACKDQINVHSSWRIGEA